MDGAVTPDLTGNALQGIRPPLSAGVCEEHGSRGRRNTQHCPLFARACS